MATDFVIDPAELLPDGRLIFAWDFADFVQDTYDSFVSAYETEYVPELDSLDRELHSYFYDVRYYGLTGWMTDVTIAVAKMVDVDLPNLDELDELDDYLPIKKFYDRFTYDCQLVALKLTYGFMDLYDNYADATALRQVALREAAEAEAKRKESADLDWRKCGM